MPTLKFSSSTRVIGVKRSRAEKIKGPSNDEMNTDQSKIANLGRDTVDMSVRVKVFTLQESPRTNGTSAPTGTRRIAILCILGNSTARSHAQSIKSGIKEILTLLPTGGPQPAVAKGSRQQLHLARSMPTPQTNPASPSAASRWCCW